MPLSDAYVDFIAGWASGAASVIALQPVDTVLTRWQAGLIDVGRVNWTVSARSLAQNFGVRALWRGASPMVSAVPIQNAVLMGGYGIGQKYAEESAAQAKLMAIFIGGCTGGVLQSFLMSPVELIKVSQQCDLQADAISKGKTVARSMFSSSSWRGLSATLLRDGIPHGVWFASYEACKDILTPFMGKDNVAVPLSSGAVAATVAWAVGYPFDLIKTRQQAGSNLSVTETASRLIAEADGRVIQGLYSGFRLKLLRAVPASMIGFSVYECVKLQLV
ncbi:hypothetical protein FisN_17Lh238 [Fistulifera solaris]|uniref:Solute carrier family 25 (Mitochondrial carnitine/acylcarnitine transporter), member 20/29 n=1 Tax=Fistulifera solaris TaxID=1519565 RepID=A0A1Z5KM28_FISSO|nr:hypothetical protein FisN_17Lh238 [Fistulifera solaris]|eukprot:GAX27380.1 hypothetical protein FisN_17Lh238 [Fistulifera solaris]